MHRIVAILFSSPVGGGNMPNSCLTFTTVDKNKEEEVERIQKNQNRERGKLDWISTVIQLLYWVLKHQTSPQHSDIKLLA